MSDKKRETSLRVSNKPSKLLPRDISESLGKLPPQALDLEEAILGALMLERGAYPVLKDFFKPEYLYTEAHREIYTAIEILSSKGAPIDMRTVVNQLRIDGKLELVGGAHYIAELTSKVSSSANIEYHSRVVMEMHIKRELIQIASQIHQQAYEDSTDAIDLLELIVEQAQATERDVLQTSGPNKVKALWKDKNLIAEPSEPPPILFIDGIPVMWPGGHSLLVGKKKSRKTLFVVWLIAQYLKGSHTTGNEILIFDTEQSKRHVFLIRKKIHKMTGKWVNVFFLRGMSPEERKDFIRDTVAYWPVPPAIIVNDGIRDLMKDINSTDESTDVITWLEKLILTERPDTKQLPHVIDILHLNKGDSNPRGHIGTELLNKAECTIELELDEKAGCTNVRCESSREKPFNKFSFTHDENDLPAIVQNVGGSAVTPDDRKNRLHIIFEGKMLSRKQTIDGIREQFAVGANKAATLLAEFRRYDPPWIIKIGEDHHPDTKYKLSIPENGYEYHPPVPNPDLFTESHAREETVEPNSDDLPF